MTLEEFKKYRQDFLSYIDVERNLSLNTQRAYQSDLHLFEQFWHQIQEQEGELIDFQRAAERHLVSLFYKQMDNDSIARRVSCFHSFKNFLLKCGVQASISIARPRLEKKLPLYLTQEKMFHLLDKVPLSNLPTQRPLRDKAILELLYATGIRCSELCTMRFADIDFSSKTIRIKGKGRKERFALFGTKAQTCLQEYLEHERPRAQSPKEHIFLSQHNHPLTTRSVQRIIKMFRVFLGGHKALTPHKIRHSFATHLLNQGLDIRIVQELLGHALLATTEKYTHVTLKDLKETCAQLHPLNNPPSDEQS